MDRNAQERKSAWKKLTIRPLLFFFPPPTYFSSPPPAFLSRHASVPANQHRPRQGEGARRERRGGGSRVGGRGGGKQRRTVAASLGLWGGSTPGWRKKGGGRGVQTGRECDWEGLSLRIEIKMNGRGAGVSALFTVIKRTSSASHFFTRNHQTHTHTHTQFAMLQFVWVSVRDRRRDGDGSLFPGHCTIFA